MMSPCYGSISEDECASHKHVEWKVDFRLLQKSSDVELGSPDFTVGSQHYALNLRRYEYRREFWVVLRLFRKGSSADGSPVRWWAGLQRGDGTYSYRNKFGKLNLAKEFSIWTEVEELLRVSEDELKKDYLGPDSCLTAFFQMKVALSSTRAEACTHCPPRLLPSFVGNITEEECTSHKRVDWNIGTRECRALSPVFQIGNQSYMLEFISENGYALLLYRMGPSIDGPARSVRWWVGLKRGDGTYHHRNAFEDLNLEEEFLIWTEATRLLHIESWELWESELNSITVFFQMKMEQSPTRSETCSHGSPRDIFSRSDGVVYEEECTFHKHVEWIVQYAGQKYWTSAVFEAGKQLYRLMFFNHGNESTLRLFRLGPSVGDPGNCVRWWAGLKRTDGTYHHENKCGTLYLQKECELWSEVEQLVPAISYKTIKGHLGPGERLAFIFWINTGTGNEPCTRRRSDMFPRGIGSIIEEELTSYKLVRWNFKFDLDLDPTRSVTSPVFMIGDQIYLLEVVFGICDGHLHLYRMGPSVERSLRWRAGVSYKDKMCHDLGSESGKLNLREACDLWTLVRFLHSFRMWEDEMLHLVVDFLMTLEQSPSAGEVCVSAEGQVRDSDHLPTDDILFRVKDKTFRMQRAIICFEVPRMGFEYRHSTSESGTGVVHITDCEPSVFEEFLKIIESGFGQVPSAETALPLYAVADKYLLDNLKKMCVKRIAETMSVDSFCDIVRLCFRHNEKGLLKSATRFLSRNKEIAESDCFSNLVSENPDAANELKAKAFSPEQPAPELPFVANFTVTQTLC